MMPIPMRREGPKNTAFNHKEDTNMNLDTFQQKRLEAYFNAHATEEVKSRRKDKKLTIGGAYKWLESRLKKMVEDGEVGISSGGCVVGDDQWCYDEVMHYFTFCNEGDTYKTEKEIKAEEERQKREAEERKVKAEELRKTHAERVAKWATLTPEQIAAEVKRTRWLKKHSWNKGKPDEEVDRLIAEDEEREAKRKQEAAERKAKEAEKKRIADEKAKAKAERERVKAEREAAKRAAEERKAKWQTEQLSLF